MNKKNKNEDIASHRDKKVKRIKTHHAQSSLLSAPPVNIDCFLLEEEESLKLNTDECNTQFQELGKQLRKLLDETQALKEKKDYNAIQRQIPDYCVLFMKMKKLNRLDKHRMKRSRDAVNEAKQKVDSVHLQLQNLLYEDNHLQKEVNKCLEFRSRDEDIDLVPVEQFYEEAPEEFSKPEITKHDNHQLTLARLQWEIEQTKRLATRLKNTEATTKTLEQNVKKLKECLKNIRPTLQSILESTEPLQKKLGMSLHATRAKFREARYLPKPLYVLYIEASAYKSACDKGIHVSMHGNVEDAKVLQMNIDETVDDSGESDQEENMAKRHRHSVSVRPEESQKDVLEKHPLSVSIAITCNESTLHLEFYYLIRLDIVTISIKSYHPSQKASQSGGLLNLNSLLNCLFLEENEIPSPKYKYFLKKIKNKDDPFSNEKSGLPKKWVQQICGLHFVSETDLHGEESDVKEEIFASYVEKVIHAIRTRVLTRQSMNDQLLILEHGSRIFSDVSHLYPSNVNSQLKKWVDASWEDIMKHPSYEELTELDLIRRNATVFKMTIERGSATLTGLVVVAPDYPIRTPMILLFLSWKGTCTSATNDALRELEREVNIHYLESLPAISSNEVLIYQIRHLLTCFDIFLETDHSKEALEGPCEFRREKVLTRMYRGRSHSRPYKYLSTKNIFTHY